MAKWVKGQRPPGAGKPKGAKSHATPAELWQMMLPDAINVHNEIVNSAKVNPMARLKAADTIIERALGKVPQENRISGKIEFIILPSEQDDGK